MDIALLIGRALLGLLFIQSAVGHLTATEQLTAYATMKRVPMARAAVLGSGVVFGLAGLALVIGARVDVASWVLVAAMVPTTLMMHGFWNVGEENAQTERTAFNKNLAIIGGLIALAAAGGGALQAIA